MRVTFRFNNKRYIEIDAEQMFNSEALPNTIDKTAVFDQIAYILQHRQGWLWYESSLGSLRGINLANVEDIEIRPTL